MLRALNAHEEDSVRSAPRGDLYSLIDYIAVLTGGEEHVPSHGIQRRLVRAIMRDWPKFDTEGMWPTAVQSERRRRGLPVRHPDERRSRALLEDLRAALGRTRDGLAALVRQASGVGRDVVYVPDWDQFAQIVTAAADPARPEMLVLLEYFESLLGADVGHAQRRRLRERKNRSGALEDTILWRFFFASGRDAARQAGQIVPLLLLETPGGVPDAGDSIYLRRSTHVRFFGLINAVFPASATVARAAGAALSAMSSDWRIYVVRELLDQCSDLGAWSAVWRLLAAVAASHFGHSVLPNADAETLALRILGVSSSDVEAAAAAAAAAAGSEGRRTLAGEYEYLAMLVSGALWCLLAHPTDGGLPDDTDALESLVQRIRSGFAKLASQAVAAGVQIDESIAWIDAQQAIAVATQMATAGGLAVGADAECGTDAYR